MCRVSGNIISLLWVPWPPLQAPHLTLAAAEARRTHCTPWLPDIPFLPSSCIQSSGISRGPQLWAPAWYHQHLEPLPTPAEAMLPKLTKMGSWAEWTALVGGGGGPQGSGRGARDFRMSQGDGSQNVPPSHLLAEEQREGWGCMPAEGAGLSRELLPSGPELPFPVRSGAASQPGQGKGSAAKTNRTRQVSEQAGQDPSPWHCRAGARGRLGLLWTLDHIPRRCLCQRGLPADGTRQAH